MAQPLDLHEIEKKWALYWQKHNIFGYREGEKKPVFVVDTPPPTVSGKMHLGHAFSYTQADMIARFQRMRGKKVLYPFGVDDNGLPTERMVEKNLNIRAKDFPRQKFIEMCLKETEKVEKELVADFYSLGLSIDWKIFYRTIDKEAQKTCQQSFVEIHKMGRAYQKVAPTMWCPKCETAIAQAELEDAELQSKFVFIKAQVEGGGQIVYATTRPELLHASVCISEHPDDLQYKSLVGKKARIPISEKWVPIIADAETKMDFGTGAVYWCPYGDMKDIDFLERHKEFAPVVVLEKNGALNEKAGKYAGLKVAQAREKIIDDLKAGGFVEKIEPVKHMVNVHERCRAPIEIITSKQWFVKYLDLKEKFLAQAKKINWRPAHMRVRLDNWINGLKWDWNVSRQRFFGVPIPVWYCKKCGEAKIARIKDLPVDPTESQPKEKCRCGSNDFVGEADVFDTWATSSLTPQIVLKWGGDKKFFKKHFPMGLRPQAHDIINLWAFYTIVKAYLHEKSVPWKTIMISGHALDAKGHKMSKSIGNVIEPKAILDQFSADILRYWAASATLGEDLPYQEKELVSGKKFVTKLFNAASFVQTATGGIKLKKNSEKKLELRIADKWILAKLNLAKKEATSALEGYEFSKALSVARNFFWLDFADYYIEEVKYRIYAQKDSASKTAAQFVLREVFFDTLKLLAPVMPFITEEIAQEFFAPELFEKSIHLEEWPAANKNFGDKKAKELGEQLKQIIEAVRKEKTKKQLALNKDIEKITVFGGPGLEGILEEVQKTMNAKAVELRGGKGEIAVNEKITLSVKF